MKIFPASVLSDRSDFYILPWYALYCLLHISALLHICCMSKIVIINATGMLQYNTFAWQNLIRMISSRIDNGRSEPRTATVASAKIENTTAWITFIFESK